MIEPSTTTTIILVLAWLIGLSRGLLHTGYYWQLKEYRWDRMQDFLGSKKGRSLIYSPYNILSLLTVLVLAFGIFRPEEEVAANGIWLLLILVTLQNLFRIAQNLYRKTLYRPKLTFKMLLILASAALIEAFIIYSFEAHPASILTLEIIRPISFTAVLHLVGIPFIFLKKYIIYKATQRRKTFRELKVVGITGSYGKSSTKEFLYKILEQKFKTVKTPKHINVDIGIAQVMLKEVNAEHEVFVVEMGAYRSGEIKASCNIVKPDIGLITGVNEQHLTFFGNIETTIKTKAELFTSLRPEGLAVVNADCKNALQTLQYNNAEKVVRYGTVGKHHLYATNIHQRAHVITFTVHCDHKTAKFEVPVFGVHYVQNLLGCVAVCLELGLSLKEIAEYAKLCEVLDGSLQVFEGKRGVTLIDDSYNANPDGFIAALNAVKDLKPKNFVLVTPGMMELGTRSNEIHRRIGQRIAEICDKVVITSEDAYEVLSSTIYECSKKTEVFFETDHEKLTKLLKSQTKKGDMILFENRIPQIVIEQLKKN